MGRTIGIDFGTTNSLMSVILTDRDGDSVTSFLQDKNNMPHPLVLS